MVHLSSYSMGDTFNSLLTAIKWAVENDVFLADFVEKYSLPHLALVTKGQYLGVGAPNIASPNLKPYVLVHSRQRTRKVLGQLVRLKDKKKATLLDNKVSIPEDFDGFFEILSEDGKPVKCLETVKELCDVFPEIILVREAMKAYVPDQDGELRTLYKSRQIAEGEQLTLVGVFQYKRDQFLRCYDEIGHSVYLKMSQKGKFSPIAKRDAITGVHSLKNLIDSKRLPLTVKLAFGQFPDEFHTGHGPVILRLQHVFQEDVVIVYTLQKEGEFYSVPINAFLKLAPSSNQPQVVVRADFKELCQRVAEVLPPFVNRILPFYDHYATQPTLPDVVVSRDRYMTSSTLDEAMSTSPAANRKPAVSDEEIDQLYDYIRGLAPLPDRHERERPAPPPLSTLPSSKSANSMHKSASPASGKSPMDTAKSPIPAKIPESMETRRHSRGSEHRRRENRARSSEKLGEPVIITAGTDVYFVEEPESEISGPTQQHHLKENFTPPPMRARPVSGRRPPGKPRPYSMVIPDTVPLFPAHGFAEYYTPYVAAPQHPMYAQGAAYPGYMPHGFVGGPAPFAPRAAPYFPRYPVHPY